MFFLNQNCNLLLIFRVIYFPEIRIYFLQTPSDFPMIGIMPKFE
jgi:hypothetical protein